MAMDTQAVVEAYFTRVNAGDWEGWLSLFADDAVLVEPIGTIAGIDQLRGGVGPLKQGYARFENRLLDLIVAGNRAVAITHISATTRSGAAVEVDVANVYQIADGKITRQRNYFDPAGVQPFLDEFKKGG